MRKQQTPSYSVLLMKHRLVSPRATATDCWGVWQRVCEDPVVRERSMKRAAKHRPHQLPSVHAGYTYAAPILNAMTAAELQALRDRLGVRPVKEFAVR
ncbi:MAG TPA: hypothetical protein VMP68_14525 [Candidatus Eisenbacteria bacterium]|nr:hypothetical protein [Candidatus Eisenbacteria bacterium]